MSTSYLAWWVSGRESFFRIKAVWGGVVFYLLSGSRHGLSLGLLKE